MNSKTKTFGKRKAYYANQYAITERNKKRRAERYKRKMEKLRKKKLQKLNKDNE